MTTIPFHCPGCRRPMQVRANPAGSRCRCPVCRQVFEVPARRSPGLDIPIAVEPWEPEEADPFAGLREQNGRIVSRRQITKTLGDGYARDALGWGAASLAMFFFPCLSWFAVLLTGYGLIVDIQALRVCSVSRNERPLVCSVFGFLMSAVAGCLWLVGILTVLASRR